MKAFSVALFAGVMAWLSAESGFAAEAPAAKETVLYSFGKRGSTDGSGPYLARLVNLNGMLYGTTLSGGTHGDGTAFTIDPATGAEKVLYSFCSQANCADGTGLANLTNVNGMLYGTTSGGGRLCSCGTLFSLDPATGVETVVYLFHTCTKRNCTDGNRPYAGVTDVKGTLYGTTLLGGPGAIQPSGTVFAFDPKTGKEQVLYSFCSRTDCSDGQFPESSLIDVKGTLYGTSTYGGRGGLGACDSPYYGCGVVFSLDLATGAEKTLYAFCSKSNCADGEIPLAGLIQTNGTLYGTTSEGGGTGCGGRGCGTVFALDLNTGTETVLHSFQDDRTDGAGPYAGLINVMGTLYGTTYGGGRHEHGTAFSMKP
jgi:uncharacterized repeat protein (TIGR03803 family)